MTLILTGSSNDKVCEIYRFHILVPLTFLALKFLIMQLFRYLDMLNEYVGYLQLLDLLQVTSWTSCSSNLDLSFPGTLQKNLLLFTSLTYVDLHVKYRFLHIILQVAQTKTKKDNVGESLEDDDIKETKAEKEITSKVYICNVFGISFMYEKCLFDHVSNFQLNDYFVL